jgi:nucleotide-binding universal stress UspA family protein
MWRHARLPGTAIRVGNPARLIAEEAASGPGVDLLVLGTHRRRPVRDVLEGTIAEKVLASRACPVLIAGAPPDAKPDAQYRRVLLALDVSSASAGAIRAAEQLVLTEETTATIVHADEPPYQGMFNYANVNIEHIADYVQGWRGATTRGIRSLVRRESGDPTRFGIHVEAGNTVPGILRAVEHYGPDLLVMGTRGGGRLHRALLGSVANSVIRDVNCDVMVVPTGTVTARGASPDALAGRHPSGTASSSAGAMR